MSFMPAFWNEERAVFTFEVLFDSRAAGVVSPVILFAEHPYQLACPCFAFRDVVWVEAVPAEVVLRVFWLYMRVIT